MQLPQKMPIWTGGKAAIGRIWGASAKKEDPGANRSQLSKTVVPDMVRRVKKEINGETGTGRRGGPGEHFPNYK